MKLSRIIIYIFLIFFTGFFLLHFVKREIKDLNETSKVEKIKYNLRELRIALDKYYKVAGKYPNLTETGVENNLKLLDYYDEKGNLISFEQIYGKNKISSTPEFSKYLPNNKVYDMNDFTKGSNIGGWNYNYSEQTGEIHVNLPMEAFNQKIDWQRQ
ncbi:hypothetical protein SAMN02745174_00542 [Cetobacterium ceti]|uniref:Type II secretory pathway, pseudopilin PulG n=1 Tax=Cetobacterium ceti TaxID=180163 RepID=A0A1T4KQL2_9FUSO|nr:hypothetical protein [Cetobacterium ceti]SJZ44704.1 hypothetical protein SAMN02745174_00542 [Cetobacterium ceti]